MADGKHEPRNVITAEMLETHFMLERLAELQEESKSMTEKLREADKEFEEIVASASAGDYQKDGKSVLCVASHDDLVGLKLFLEKNPAWVGIISIEDAPMESRNALCEKVIEVVGNKNITVEISKE